MVRPESCVELAGVSPVRVSIGAPGSRPRFVIETWRAERGVKSLFGGRKIAVPRHGREGFDFLGCHFRARMSGRLWEQRGIVRYYLQRWPSQRAMKRLREKIHDRTDRRYSGTDIRVVIDALNPILRGWGNYFRTGNAADKFTQLDRYPVGLYRLRGTIRYPKAA